MNINKNLMSRNHTAMKRTKADIQYIVIHYVGALGDAKANTDYYKSTDVGASADFWVGHGGDIWRGNDYWNYYSWHCGGGRQTSGGGAYLGKCTNRNSVGIEMCVKKRSTKTMNATDKDWYFEEATVRAAAELVSYLMDELDIDIDHVIRHYDVNGKICPNPFVYDNGAYSWDAFKKLCSGSAPKETEWYRVRKLWEDADSQLGAYENLDNATKNCPSGYKVYDNSGKCVYEAPVVSGTQSSEFAGMDDKDAAEKMLELVKPIAEKYGLFPSVITGQSLLESGYCHTTKLSGYNNVIGMKCDLINSQWSGSSWDGKSKVLIHTPEQDANGNTYYIDAYFRVYPCIEDCVTDICAFFTSLSKYKGVTDCSNYKEQIKFIRSHGYATDVNYDKKVCSLIEQFGLNKYDKAADILPDTQEPWYRVRRTWADAKSQIGAYHNLTKAKECVDKHAGYAVFDEDGTKIYPADKTPKQTVDDACAWSVGIANDNSHGYNNDGKGWGPEYNCIGLLMSAYMQAGIPLTPCNIDVMPAMLKSHGFEECTSEVDFATGKGAAKGYVFWMLDSSGKHGHTEMYLGNNKQVGARGDFDGKAGDSSGSEIAVSAYQNFGWQKCFRLKGAYTSDAKVKEPCVVQVGFYQIKANADKMVSKPKAAGFNAFVKIATDGGYYVQAGAFDYRDNAEVLVDKLSKAGFVSIIK